ncbi:LysR family transcriptional regulator [Dongia mobilis]|uniref:LysR family transcriptional regulator n=1 Tax=Dongia mobilis TaxID=578943 RepID=A0A4R6WW51_9PROT|nr:LysR family transcriptional regulator [Dongia mobilis]TDQ85505.1 LysR family transcriptional regulator [Dongia mobilis]
MLMRQLAYLAALARERHFARAAAACNITQPALSTAIKQLEEELGVPLVERDKRFKGFTPEGQEVLLWARRILSDFDSLKQGIQNAKRGLTGNLRLGVIPSALPLVPHVTDPFNDRHPQVKVTVWSTSSIEIQQGLDHFELEAGITYLDNEPLKGVLQRPLYTERYVLLTSETGPLAGATKATWREAADLPLCLLTPNMQNRRIIDGVFKSLDCAPRPQLETNSVINLCAHVRSGRLSSIVPKSLIQVLGMPAGAVALDLVAPEVSRQVGLVVPDREPLPPISLAIFSMQFPGFHESQ